MQLNLSKKACLFAAFVVAVAIAHGGHSHSHGAHSHAAHSHGAHDHAHDHDHDHDHDHEHVDEIKQETPAQRNLQVTVETNIHKQFVGNLIIMTGGDKIFSLVDEWMRPLPFLVQSIFSTLFISIVPIFLIYGMNLFMGGKEGSDYFTKIMLSFAMGGLLGDVFFHTLPHLGEGIEHVHATEEGGHPPHSEEAMQLNLIIIVGIWCFFLLEKITHKYLDSQHDHNHGHNHDHSAPKAVEQPATKGKGKKGKQSAKVAEKVEDIDTLLNNHVDHSAEKKLKSFAVISIAGDFIHNFTDGLSIGVSYVADFKMGLITTMAMFFHEIPHEVGDFAILFQLKWSIWRIVGVQLMTATGALVGTAIGSLLGQIYLKEALAFTSGGFLYFAVNGLLSELKEVDDIVQLFFCFCSMSVGLYMMYVFALFE